MLDIEPPVLKLKYNRATYKFPKTYLLRNGYRSQMIAYKWKPLLQSVEFSQTDLPGVREGKGARFEFAVVDTARGRSPKVDLPKLLIAYIRVPHIKRLVSNEVGVG